MDEIIKEEQLKLANHLKGLSAEERKKQGLVLLCYMQGYEAGYQSALQNEEQNALKNE